MTMPFDLAIKNSLIFDGSGAPARRADIGMRDGRITGVGALDGAATRTIDADGLAVAPGIIDTHCHYDAQVLWDPLLTSSCWHGVTTAVMGNCGFTLAPCRPEDREFLLTLLARVEDISATALRAGLDWAWESFPEYRRHVGAGLGLNVAAYLGHTALRRYVLGEAASERAANEDELAQMQAVLREALAAGAVGFSTSIGPTHVDAAGRPVPSRLATEEELVALAGVLAEFRTGAVEVNPRGIITGITEEDMRLMEALSCAAGRPAQWDGFNYHPEHPLAHRLAMRLMEAANARGAQLFGQSRLYGSERTFDLRRTAFFDGLDVWRDLFALPRAERAARLADPALRPALRAAIDHPAADGARGPLRRQIRWPALAVHRAARPEHRPLEGRALTDLAAEQDKHVADVLLDLALAEDLATEFRYTRVLPEDEPHIAEILTHPQCILGNSDAGAHVNTDCLAGESTYGLAYWTRERGLFPLEEAVRRLTAVPADVFGLGDRGRIAEGLAADLMIFDPATIDLGPKAHVPDFPAGETRLVQGATGITHTIINGAVVIEDGRDTGARPGRFIGGAGT
jgi:N-acyl-D-aspartate/D-glutamate deacylase